MARIAVVDLVFNYPPNGGASVDLYGLLSRLKNEHEITLFLPNHKKIKVAPDFDISYKLIDVSYFEFNHKKYPQKLREEIERYRPDYLLIADGWYLKPYIVNALKDLKPILRLYAYETLCLKSHGHFARLGKSCKKNYLADSWASLFECKICSLLWILINHNRVFLQEYLNSKVYMPGYADVVKDALRNAHKIVVYNDYTKSLISDYNGNILVVPSGVDPETFKPQPEIRVGNGIDILVFGRLEHWFKGVGSVVEACRKIWEKRKDFKLKITSSDRFKELFIEPVGWVDHTALPSLINNVDICIVPSIWEEPFGISVVEAMACGKAVLGSDAGGIPNIIEDNISGLIFKRGVKDDLVEKLELLMNDAELRERLGKAARRRVEENYSWDEIIGRHYKPLFA